MYFFVFIIRKYGYIDRDGNIKLQKCVIFYGVTGTITQFFGVGEKESSVILLLTYTLAPVALTLWSTLFLWLVN